RERPRLFPSLLTSTALPPDGMGFLPFLSKDEVNHCILVLTALCLIGTVFAFASLFILSSIKRSRSERKAKVNPPPASIPHSVAVTVSPTDKNQVSIKIGEEMEYIDDRNTNVVSSTVQIASIHESPAPANL
ncbi:hypothetical protein PENTCL1PPCAC_1818, partial [Pristionchus entomophagus]